MRPQGNGPFPAALVLHTRGGLSEHTLLQAQWLASQGFVAYAPDYFTPLGLDPITFDRTSFMARQSVAARDLLVGAISCLRERGDVDPGRVGVVGFSLGAYLGLMLAARSDVNAVAAWYSTYAGSPFTTPAEIPFTQLAGAVQRPLLITHGEADQEVRIDAARTAQGILSGLGKVSEFKEYPGVGHGYDQTGVARYVYDANATNDSRARTAALLRVKR